MSQPISLRSYQPASTPVVRAIADASARTGVDFDYMYSKARLESNLDPNAKASTSSAAGLFQFTRQTWLSTVKQHGAKHGLGWAADAIHKNAKGHFSVGDTAMRAQIQSLRYQPEAASAMAAEFAGDNRDHLRAALGRPPGEVDLYLAHFLGAGGATRFLKQHDRNPDQSASSLFPTAAAANKGVFYNRAGQSRSLSEVRDFFQAKLDADNGSTPAAAQTGTHMTQQPAPMQARFTSAGTPLPQASMTGTADEQSPPPIRMLSIRPMPKRLSLDFANDTYARLAAMGWSK